MSMQRDNGSAGGRKLSVVVIPRTINAVVSLYELSPSQNSAGIFDCEAFASIDGDDFPLVGVVFGTILNVDVFLIAARMSE